MKLRPLLTTLSLFLALAGPAFAKLQVRLVAVGPDGIGGHWAQPNADFKWVLDSYAKGSSKQTEKDGRMSFGTFSLEAGNGASFGTTYDASLLAHLRSGGQAGITAGTAFLYEKYAQGDLSRVLPDFHYDGQAAVSLQQAIWALERNEADAVPAAICTLILKHFGSWARAQAHYEGGSVHILALSANNGRGLEGGDHLVYLPGTSMLDAPLLGYRPIGSTPQPPTWFLPITPPGNPNVITERKLEEIVDEIVTEFPTTFPPKNPLNDNDITGSTPPGLRTDDNNINNNPYVPNDPPGFNFVSDPPDSTHVPDAGSTALLMLLGLGFAGFVHRRLRR